MKVMKPIKTLFWVSGGLLAVLVAISLMHTPGVTIENRGKIPTTSYGAFLAAQHALYTNNFDKADEFIAEIDPAAVEYKPVQEVRVLTDFLNGKIPANTDNLSKQKNIVARVVTDAKLVTDGKWNDVCSKHKNDKMRMMAPLRIWSGIATNHITLTFKYIDSLDTNPSWQAFLRGQIYAEQGKIQKAIEAFDKVRPEFMNISDYLYLMSFYKHNNLTQQANNLRTKFTTKPGSMFMAGYTDVPDWSKYAGYKNQLAFNFVQTVAHTQNLSRSDLSLLLLHFAKNVGDENQIQHDAINYHAGLYMISNMGNYGKYFQNISETSPYYPFVNLRLAELNHDERAIRRAIDAQPLFMPAVNLYVGWQIQKGDKAGALKTINNALNNADISTSARAYLYKMRAETNFIFDDFDASQKDLDSAFNVIQKPDPDIFSVQARIWAAKGENLDKAYAYSLSLVQFAPTDTCTWDTLGYVIWAREGLTAALDIVERVGEFANSCSALFEHLGDMYVAAGEDNRAVDAYLRAIELSNDGLSIKPVLEKKIKRIK